MLCTACGTRISQRDSNCPNCGKLLRSPSFAESSSAPRETTEPPQLSPSSARLEPDPQPEPERDRTGSTDRGGNTDRTGSTGNTDRAGNTDRTGSTERAERSQAESQQMERRNRKSPRRTADAKPSTRPAASFTPSTAEIRALAAERPELIEPGLRIHREDGGKTLGAGYPSDVGTIDLLARDDSGGFVVVMVADSEQGKEILGEMLQRVGWVRKHLAHDHQEVRGIVLISELPEEVGYAAAAVGDTLAFKTYRMAVTFEPIKL